MPYSERIRKSREQITQLVNDSIQNRPMIEKLTTEPLGILRRQDITANIDAPLSFTQIAARYPMLAEDTSSEVFRQRTNKVFQYIKALRTLREDPTSVFFRDDNEQERIAAEKAIVDLVLNDQEINPKNAGQETLLDRMSNDFETVEDLVVLCNLRLIPFVVNTRFKNILARSSVTISEEELFNECYGPLRRAVEKYNPDNPEGKTFGGFAADGIEEHLKTYIAGHEFAIRVSQYIQERYSLYKQIINVLTHQLGRKPTSEDIFPLMAPALARKNVVNSGNKNPTDEEIKTYINTHQDAIREDIEELETLILTARTIRSIDAPVTLDSGETVTLSEILVAPESTIQGEQSPLDPGELLSLSPLSRDIYVMLVGEEKRPSGRTPKDLARNSEKLFNEQIPSEEIETIYKRAKNHIDWKRKTIGPHNSLIVTDFDTMLCAITGLNQTNGPARERINRLKPHERLALELVYFKGLQLEEAGAEMSIKTKQRMSSICQDAIAVLKGEERPSVLKDRQYKSRRNRGTSK